MNNLCAFAFLWKAPPLRGINSIIFMVLTVLLSLFIVSCADMFQPKIPFGDRDTPSSLGDLFRNVEGIEKLDTPEQFYIAPFYSPSEISLTWTAVLGAAYYMVERAVVPPVPGSNPLEWVLPDKDGGYEPLERFVYGTKYIDQILRTPALDSSEYRNRYFYRISAFNTSKRYEESDPTEPQSAMLFRAPVNAKASGGTSTDFIELRWDHSEGSDSYEVWRSDFSSGSSATLLGIVLGNQNWYRNNVSPAEQGKDFYYMVRARNKFGNQSLLTRPAYGYAKVFGAPDAPHNVRLEKENGDPSGRGHSKSEISIKWDKDESPDAYYAVFRYSSIDSSLTRLTDKTDEIFWNDNAGLRPGIYYYYRVQAIVDDIKEGKALKSEFSYPDPEGFILSSPDTVVAERSQSGVITVKWLPAMGNENERLQYTYNIYSDTLTTGNFSNVIASGVNPDTDAQGFISEVITNAPAGHTFFNVSTVNKVNGADVESGKSVVVSPAPAAAVILSVSQHAFISSNAAANSSGIYPVRITWKKPDNDTPAFYHVQRSARSGTGFSRANEQPLNANGPWTDFYFYDNATGVYTYIDTNETARVARKYYYRVLSLNQLEQGNFPSDERIGWGALTHEQWIAEFNKTYASAIYKLTLMHRPSDTDKLGTETKYGTISGDIYYNARIAGLGGDITVRQTNYADFYIENDPANGIYFILNGNSGSEANMSGNGKMKNETITCTGMYPGKIYHGSVQLTGGKVSGGTYRVTPDGFADKELTATVYGYAAGK